MLLQQSSAFQMQDSQVRAFVCSKSRDVRRASHSRSLRPVSTAQQVPPNKEPKESRRDKLERALTSFRSPARVAAQKVSPHCAVKAKHTIVSRCSQAVCQLNTRHFAHSYSKRRWKWTPVAYQEQYKTLSIAGKLLTTRLIKMLRQPATAARCRTDLGQVLKAKANPVAT